MYFRDENLCLGDENWNFEDENLYFWDEICIFEINIGIKEIKIVEIQVTRPTPLFCTAKKNIFWQVKHISSFLWVFKFWKSSNPIRCYEYTLLDKKNVGQKWRNFLEVTKILSGENFCPTKILSDEIFCPTKFCPTSFMFCDLHFFQVL